MTLTLTLRLAGSRILKRLGEFASLLVDPAGDDNSVLYTAKTAGAGGELVSIAYAAPAEQATTTVAVSTNAITVTPGTKARMVIGGTLSPDIERTLIYAGIRGGFPHWTSNGLTKDENDGNGAFTYLSKVGPYWWLGSKDASNFDVYIAEVESDATTPDGLTGWTNNFGTGTPTVTAGISNAAQVIAAVNASSPAAALVTASASGPSTGPVAAVAAANLTLPAPPTNALTLDGVVLTLGGATLTLD